MVPDFISGKIASYWLNAYVDATVACYLIDYVQTGCLPTGDDPAQVRTRLLIDRASADRHLERVVVRAYTERHLNGHADMILAGLLDRLLGARVIDDPTPWVEEQFTLRMMFYPWPLLYRGDFAHLHAYARDEAGIDLALAPHDIIHEVCAVQIENIAVNAQNRLRLQDLARLPDFDDNPKLRRLREMAMHYRRPRMFLWSAARSQKMASRWDWLFMHTLRLRYRRLPAAAS